MVVCSHTNWTCGYTDTSQILHMIRVADTVIWCIANTIDTLLFTYWLAFTKNMSVPLITLTACGDTAQRWIRLNTYTIEDTFWNWDLWLDYIIILFVWTNSPYAGQWCWVTYTISTYNTTIIFGQRCYPTNSYILFKTNEEKEKKTRKTKKIYPIRLNFLYPVIFFHNCFSFIFGPLKYKISYGTSLWQTPNDRRANVWFTKSW